MNTPNESNTQTDLNRVLEKITEIANASADGDYIYRGESKSHDEVSSNLYREYKDEIETEHFDIEVVQNEILREAREYTTHKMDDPEILAELQHHGGKTNLIDFTTDYLVALFFACDGNRDEPGRVILLQNQSEVYKVVKPPRTIPRAGGQKSIFVQSPSGIVAPNTVVCIPTDLKGVMLDYLQKHHDISTRTIYNDLQGFIENRRIHQSAYTEFYKGVTCDERADSTRNPAEKQEWYNKAIVHYTEAIGLNPELAETYTNRGNAYGEIGEFDEAIQDYTKAINLNPEHVTAYYNRGIAYYYKGEFDEAIRNYDQAINLKPDHANAYNNRGFAYKDKGKFDNAIQDFNKTIDLKPDHANAYTNRIAAWLYLRKWEKARADLRTAKDMGIDIIDFFHNNYESVAAFEWKHGVKVPEDIAALLR